MSSNRSTPAPPVTNPPARPGRKASFNVKVAPSDATESKTRSRASSNSNPYDKPSSRESRQSSSFWNEEKTDSPVTVYPELNKDRDSTWNRPEFNIKDGPKMHEKRSTTPLFTTQQVAPAPGTTYYQLVVQQGDTILLRDWPRQRMSQKWTRDGTLNPGQIEITFDEFLQGELRDQIVYIFGQEILDHVTEFVSKEREKPKKTDPSKKAE